MLVPVRCFTCNASVGHAWRGYVERTAAGDRFEDIMADAGLRRYCCRRMIRTHVDVGSLVAHHRFTDTKEGHSTFSCVAHEPRTLSCD